MESTVPEQPAPRPADYLSLVVIWSLVLFTCLLGGMLGSAAAYLLFEWAGLDFMAAMGQFGEDSPLMHRNLMRAVAMVNHIFTFLLPGFFLMWFLARRHWVRYFHLDRRPLPDSLGWGALLMLLVFPIAQFAYWLNRQIPLPEWATEMETTTAELLKGLLIMHSPAELLFNLLVIALLPAIGEELIFRGLVQQTLERRIKRPEAAVWIAAVVFSFIHFQFQGFLPRLLLGAVLGYLYFWTRNLWVPIVIHFLNNGVQVMGAYWYRDAVINMEPEQLDNANGISAAVALVLAAVLFWYFKNKKAPAWREKREGQIPDV